MTAACCAALRCRYERDFLRLCREAGFVAPLRLEARTFEARARAGLRGLPGWGRGEPRVPAVLPGDGAGSAHASATAHR